jgi:Cu-Zn family superoxide dismutase
LSNNIHADAQGVVDFVYFDDLIQLEGPQSIAGRMVVIHANPDDLGAFRNQNTPQGKESGKTGNAGARIACSVIGITDTDLHPSDAEIARAEKYRERTMAIRHGRVSQI